VSGDETRPEDDLPPDLAKAVDDAVARMLADLMAEDDKPVVISSLAEANRVRRRFRRWAEVRSDAAGLLHAAEAQAALERADNALGWTLAVSDLDGSHESLHGLWEDPEEAHDTAIAWEAELNLGAESNPANRAFKVTVRLVEKYAGPPKRETR
jgi:hypothetical protein